MVKGPGKEERVTDTSTHGIYDLDNCFQAPRWPWTSRFIVIYPLAVCFDAFHKPPHHHGLVPAETGRWAHIGRRMGTLCVRRALALLDRTFRNAA